MKNKLFCLILSLLIMFAVAVPANAAMGGATYVQLIHINNGTSFDTQMRTLYKTLQDAVANAVSGDIIEVFDDVSAASPIVIPQNTELTIVSGTKREHDAIYGRILFESTDPEAITRTVTKDFDGSLFTLGEQSKVNFENIVLDGNGKGGEKGGLIYAENGSVLAIKNGVTFKNSALGENSFGGAVYAEKDAEVTIEDTVFSGNNATAGKDVYAEQKSDVAIADGITANFAYPDISGVGISGLNLILTGEIGLTFHTVVPDKYLDGTFVMTCRTEDTVTYNIADCTKDADGRYMAKFNVSSIELSEQVTLTVYDKDGNPLATKEKSVEDYGKILLACKDTTDAEKNVITKLLNYGHYSQIECSEYDGFEIGKDYAETAKYCEITTEDSAFNDYTYNWMGYDDDLTKVGIQLILGYKTDIYLHFPIADKPVVLVNGQAAEVVKSELLNYEYRISINGISALDLAEEYTVAINDKVTLKLSAMSYCNLALKQGNDNCRNAMKALYEFYEATSAYNR